MDGSMDGILELLWCMAAVEREEKYVKRVFLS